MSKGKMYCFRAEWKDSQKFEQQSVPDWICLDADWQGYKIATIPEVADVAEILGILQINDSPDQWISHLESLGLKGVTQVCCEEMFEDKGYT
jgi:hypothetical protein